VTSSLSRKNHAFLQPAINCAELKLFPDFNKPVKIILKF